MVLLTCMRLTNEDGLCTIGNMYKSDLKLSHLRPDLVRPRLPLDRFLILRFNPAQKMAGFVGVPREWPLIQVWLAKDK
jgi:hypothetical protein